MNESLYVRNIPSSALQPYLDVRPVSTKYSIMPVVDPRRRLNVPMNVEATYNIANTFNPGTRPAPWSGYASQVNVESELKNQIFALQHCDRREYVPSSTSDLYQVGIDASCQSQAHPLLFAKQTFDQCDPTPTYTQKHLFHQSTRQDTKGSHEKV
jgi:hypothetical protein